MYCQEISQESILFISAISFRGCPLIKRYTLTYVLYIVKKRVKTLNYSSRQAYVVDLVAHSSVDINPYLVPMYRQGISQETYLCKPVLLVSHSLRNLTLLCSYFHILTSLTTFLCSCLWQIPSPTISSFTTLCS